MVKEIPDVSDYHGKQTILTASIDSNKQTSITGTTNFSSGTVTRSFNIDFFSLHLIETVIDSYNDGTITKSERRTPLNNIPIPGKQILGDEAIALISNNTKNGSIRLRDHAFNRHYRQPAEWQDETPDYQRIMNKKPHSTPLEEEYEDRKLQPQQTASGWKVKAIFIPLKTGMKIIGIINSPSNEMNVCQYELNTKNEKVHLTNTLLNETTSSYELTKNGYIKPNSENFMYRTGKLNALSFPRFAWYHMFELQHELFTKEEKNSEHVHEHMNC